MTENKLSKSAEALAGKNPYSRGLDPGLSSLPPMLPVYIETLEEVFPEKIGIPCNNCGEENKVLAIILQVEAVFCSKCQKELKADYRQKLPNDWALIASAYVGLACNKNKTREVVMNANSALEVWMKRTLKTDLDYKINSKLTDYILSNLRNFEHHSKLLAFLDFKKPEKIEQELAWLRDLRNKVLHKGYVPAYEEAQKSISVVLEMMRKTKKIARSLNALGDALLARASQK